jgi:hypothetical protein
VAAQGDFHAAAAVRDEARVAAEAQQDGFAVPAAVPGGSRAEAEAWGVIHAAAEARRAGPAEAAYCAACPGAIAAEVAAGSLADALAVQVCSAEFPADEKAAAVSSADFPEDGYSRAALVALLVDDCSPAVCPGTAEAAAQGPGLAD